jgi:tetratricopeptide (TPR) repeat protein
LYQLETDSLWLDEITSALFIRESSLADVLDNLMGYSDRPLHSSIIYLFSFLGRGEFFLRLPSVMAGIFAIVLVYKVGEAIFGRKEGLVAALLLALSPLHLYYMQETRSYALFMALSLLTLYCFLQAWRSGKWLWWACFALSSILNTYTHYFSIFVLIAELIAGGILILFETLSLKGDERWLKKGLWDRQKRRLLGLSLSLLAIALAFLPSLSHLQAFLDKQGGGGALATGLEPSVTFFVQLLAQLSVGQKAIESISWILGLLFLFGLIATGLRRQIKTLLLVLVWLALPFLVLFVVPSRHFFDIRYVIFILPMFHLVVARGLIGLGELLAWLPVGTGGFRPMARRAWVIFLPLLVLFTIGPVAEYYAVEKEDWRAAVNYLKAHSQPGDLIVCDGARSTGAADGRRPYKAMIYYFPEAFEKNVVVLQQQSAQAIAPIAGEERGVWGLVYGGLGNLERKLDSQLVKPVQFKTTTVFGTQDAPGTVLDRGILLSRSLLDCLPRQARFDLYLELGKLYALRGDRDLAHKQYEQALSFVPGPLEAAALYRKLGDFQAAEASYRRALADNDQAHNIHFELATLYEEMNQPALALEEYRIASDLYPQHAVYHVRRGLMNTRLGQMEAAKGNFSEALKLEPNRAWFHLLLANTLLSLGEAKKAAGEYEQAQTLNPKYRQNAWVQLQRAHAYRLAGWIRQAIAAYQQVLTLDPDNAPAAQWLKELE